MMDLFNNNKPKFQIVDLIRQRELKDLAARKLSRKLRVTPNLLKRLGLESVLEGHEGCVNCLEWNESGNLLASASDDMKVILWDPFRYKKKLTLHTGHGGNIFTVKFMPKTNDSIIVTGAGDFKVRVHDVSISDTLLVCNCHLGRVKRCAVAPSVPFLFWSASEDGMIMQYDLRQPHSCKNLEQKSVLVNLVNHADRYVEAKCITVNPRKPELIAVGANDPFVRIYDRRMIKLSNRPTSAAVNRTTIFIEKDDVDDNVPLGCAQYFVAGHLKHRDNNKRYSTTYVTFNDDGNELLVNMGGEQIYLFDINGQKNSKSYIVPIEIENSNGEHDSNEITEDDCNDILILEDMSHKNVTELSPEVEELHQSANKAFEEKRYVNAVTLYNEAISLCPYSAMLYANRAGTYMKRSWDGDSYCALRDCRTALTLDPQHIKAHFRLAKCLFELNKVSKANIVMENFAKKFPECQNNASCKSLRKDIKEALSSGKDGVKQKNVGRLSKHEKQWRKNAFDFKMRFCGHCNTITDIKEANFFGAEGQYIVAGSDDGSFFIWDRHTTNIARILKGDQRIVNCLQPHPSTCLLATSGIDPVIRLWSPLPEDGTQNVWEVENSNEAAMANYIRMNTDHFEVMLFNMSYRMPAQGTGNNPDDNEELQDSVNQPLQCRPS